MKISAIHEATLPIGSAMRNASIAFDQMTASALVIRTDESIGGEALVGLAFDSIGRYGKGGLLRERFIPRLLAAPPEALRDDQGLIDPARCVAVLMRGEKQGGHGERPGAVGLLDAALWDLRAKQQGLPLWQCLRHATGPIGTPAATSAPPRIATYASCGHFTDNPALGALLGEELKSLMQFFMAQQYFIHLFTRLLGRGDRSLPHGAVTQQGNAQVPVHAPKQACSPTMH